MRKRGNEEKDVEELLRAAEDEMLLKLTLGSHSTRSNLDLDLDLVRRFETLKSTNNAAVSVPGKEKKGKGSNGLLLGDDLFTRFEALKGSSSSSSSGGGDGARIAGKSGGFDGGSEDEDDEVEKLMKWAMDAARLDPSKSDDDDEKDDDGEEEEDDDEDESDDDDDDERKRRTRSKQVDARGKRK